MLYRLIIACMTVFALGYLALTAQIVLDPWSETESFTSRTMPYIYGTLLTACLLALFFRSFAVAKPASADKQGLSSLALLLMALVGFVVLLPLVGLWLGLSILLGTSILVLGERRWWAITAVSLTVPLIGWMAIEWGLGITIPL